MQYTVIFIDNFDSFSYNLTDELMVLGHRVLVYRNDTSVELLQHLAKEHEEAGEKVMFMLSPGPSTPDEANNLIPIIRAMLGHCPMLGVCLGHQALGQVLGGKVTAAPEIVHGKSSDIRHHGTLAFKGLPNPLKAARYHSLIVTELPSEVEICAEYEGICMSFYAAKYRIMGFQFHLESIMTTYGRLLLKQALEVLAAPASA